jgi:hypothetical protein
MNKNKNKNKKETSWGCLLNLCTVLNPGDNGKYSLLNIRY